MSTNQIAFTKHFDTEAELIAFLTKIADTTGKTAKTKVADAEDETTGKPAGKPAAKTTTKVKAITQEQMEVALNEVKEKFDIPTAREIISEFGGVKKKDDIPESKYKAVYDACQEKLNEAEGSDEGDDDNGI
jgi:hypothetical protein